MIRRTLPWILSIGVCAFTIGLPLLGLEVFVGVDLLSIFSPWDQILPGTETRIPVSDVWDNVLPRRAISIERLRAGDFAFWDSSAAGGRELLAVPGSGLFNPINWVYFIVPFSYAPGAAKFIEMLVILVGCVLLWRRFGGTPLVGLVPGLIFAFSGFQIVWTGWSHTSTLAWLPLLFWSVERVLQDRSLRSALPFPAILAAMLLGGFPAVVVHSALAAGIFGLARMGADVFEAREIDLRKSLLGSSKVMALLTLAGLVAVCFAAFQLTGFEDSISQRNLDYRQNGGRATGNPKLLVTAAVPYAFGYPNEGDWLPGRNPIEAIAYIGSAALFLAALGFASLRKNPLTRVRAGFIAIFLTAAFFTLAQYSRGPANDLINLVPTFSQNPIGRLRGVWGFLFALLAGLGTEVLVRGAAESIWEKRVRIFAICGSTALAGATVFYVWRIDNAFTFVVPVTRGLWIAGIAFISIGVLWFNRTRLGPSWALLGVLAVVAVEGWFFASHLLPSTPKEFFYPDTPVHTYLQENLEDERAVTDIGTLWPGTSTFYGIQTVNGHAFHDDTYVDAIQLVDTKAFKSPTFNGPNLRIDNAINNPVLDRLGAQYAATSNTGDVYGEVDGPVSEFSGKREFTNGDSVTLELESVGPVRGIELYSAEGFDARKEFSQIFVSVTDGDQVIESSRRFFRLFPDSSFHMPLHGEDFPDEADLTVTLSFEGFEINPSLREETPGEIAIAPILPLDDNLKLVESRTGVIYERENALSRFRWAGESLLLEKRGDRLAALKNDFGDSTVLLSEPTELVGSGASGTVTPNLGSDQDVVNLSIDAQGAGWVVIADSLQDSWTAELNGDFVELVDADHALVAVEIPEAGEYEVVLRYNPEHKATGFYVSGIAGLAYLVLVAGVAIKGRRFDEEVSVAEG